jgi:hypothetical protein
MLKNCKFIFVKEFKHRKLSKDVEKPDFKISFISMGPNDYFRKILEVCKISDQSASRIVLQSSFESILQSIFPSFIKVEHICFYGAMLYIFQQDIMSKV